MKTALQPCNEVIYNTTNLNVSVGSKSTKRLAVFPMSLKT